MVIQKKSKKLKEMEHQARRKDIKASFFFTVKTSFLDYFISPFAIAIKSSNSLIMSLSALYGIFGPLSQIFGSKLIEKVPRKKILTKAVFWESIFILPFLLIAIFFYKGFFVNILPFLFIIFFSFYTISGNLGAPAHFSWIGDIVDQKYRGRWFSKKNLLNGFFAVILSIGAAIFLDFFTKRNQTLIGFLILFSLAFFFRIFSIRTFNKMYEPKIKLKKGSYFSFWEFIVNAPKNNFGKFVIFRGFIGFATAIASPIIAIYILRILEYSYFTYMTITLSATLFSILFIHLWGNFADKYGNYKTLALTTVFLPLIPIFWIFSPSPLYLILVPSFIGGVSWAGFNLAFGNFIYDNVSTQKRGLAVSYFNMVLGIGTFFGAGLGAFLIKILEIIPEMEAVFIIFIISAIIRMIAVLFFIPKIKEVRKTKYFNGKNAFKNIILKEIKPTLIEDVHDIKSIKKYLYA